MKHFLRTTFFISLVFTAFHGNIAAAETTVNFSQAIFPSQQAIGLIDSTGESLTEPVVELQPSTSTTPQVITHQLSTEQQTLRIINPLANTPWSVTIAASDGPQAVWKSTSGQYDFNDAVNGVDGVDEDVVGGSLTLNPLASIPTVATGSQDCTTNDLSMGSLARFEEGERRVSSITLVNGLPTSASYCSWDVLGIGMEQVVPADQSAGKYRLDFTITIL